LFGAGTRAELENEMLRIDVYDWDLAGKDDLIGIALVPMSGVLSVGFLQVALALEEKDSEDKRITVWKDYGMVQGFIRAKKLPVFNQMGQPIVLKEGINYLAVRVEKVRM
jgi:Ca2+-dependent lipid-binding protein